MTQLLLIIMLPDGKNNLMFELPPPQAMEHELSQSKSIRNQLNQLVKVEMT